MKRILAALVAALMVFAMAAPSALAATGDAEDVVVTITDPAEETDPVVDTEAETDDAEVENPQEAEETGDAKAPEKLLTPDSPFYFLKRFVESVKLFFTFDGEKRAQLLSELAEERARELEALQEKFAQGQLTEKQFKLLEKALEDLILFTEKLTTTLSPSDEDSPPGQEQGEADPGNAQDADDEAADAEEDEDVTDPEEDAKGDQEDKEIGETDEEKDEEYPDKYLRRVAHLRAIAKRAPEAAQKGLARAIANALRQRERAIAKGKILCDRNSDDATDKETYQKRQKDFSCKDQAGASKAWEKAEKQKQKLHIKDWNGRGPAKASPGKGKGKGK